MYISLKAAVAVFLSYGVVQAQIQQPVPANNQVTILQALNDTNSPALKFIEFLQSSPDYQSVLDILNDPSSNVTLFIPSDMVYYEATGQQPPASNTTNNSTRSSAIPGVIGGTPTSNPVSSIASSVAAATSSALTLPGFFSSLVAARSSANPTNVAPTLAPATTGIVQNPPSLPSFGLNAGYVKMPNVEFLQPYENVAHAASDGSKEAASLVMRALNVPTNQQASNNNNNSWEAVTTDAPFVDQFAFADLLNYHLVNGSVFLNSTNSTIVVNSLLTNNTVDKVGYGLPLLLQKKPSQQRQQQPTTMTPVATNASSPINGNWTIGSGLGNDANIIANQTIQASNGLVYIIDKILVPPVSPSESLATLQNATFFDWLLNNSNTNTSLDSTSNVTIFVPINQALQDLNVNDVNDQTVQSILQSHIVPGVYYTTNLTNQPTNVTTVANTNVTLNNANPTTNNSVTLNDNTRIVKANILLNNGVMHLIDSILTFPTVSPPPTNTTNSTGGDNGANGGANDGSNNGDANSGDANDGTNGNDPSGVGPFPLPDTASTQSSAVSSAAPIISSALMVLLCALYVHIA